jgi:hypothetical protein
MHPLPTSYNYNQLIHRPKAINMFSLQRFFVVLLVGLMLSSPTLAAYSQDTEQSATTIIESPSSTLLPQQEQEQQEHPRRQLWEFWSLIMLIHPPCPPKDAPHQPPHCVEDSSSSSTNSANGSNYDGAVSSSTSSSANMANNATSSSANALGWWTVPVVASVILAIVAMVIGSRGKEPPHEMQGAISRRVVAVAAFADHVLPPTASAQQEMV